MTNPIVRQSENASILLVEDESIVAADIRQQLESFGCTVAAWTTSGEEAIALAGSIRPDLVLMDITLAGEMNGIEAAAVIKERYSLPVLYLTANSDRATMEKALVTSPIGYVLKPFEQRELEVAVEMAVYRSRLERQLEAALRHAELEQAKSEAIISGIGMGLSMQDTGFRILYQNRISRELTGGDHTGELCYEAYRKQSTACDHCALARSFATGDVTTIEQEYPGNGCTSSYLEITASPVTGADGAIVAGVELVKDITGRKMMELALAESEERYRKLFDHSPIGIVTLEDGRIRFINPAGMTLFGTSSLEPLAGRPFTSFIHTDYQEQCAEILETDARPQMAAVETKLLRDDGLELEIEASFVSFTSSGRIQLLAILNDISERKRSEQIIRQMAYYDSLTGLPNRRLLDDRLCLTVAQARRYGRHFAILFIDLDNFKGINDRLGHTVGDELLREVAQKLRLCCKRASETVARFGGDEFVIIIPEITDVAKVEEIVRKIFRELRKTIRVREHLLTTTPSIGISIYPFDGEVPQTLVMHADAALYRAKEAGRNTFRFFSEPCQYRGSS